MEKTATVLINCEFYLMGQGSMSFPLWDPLSQLRETQEDIYRLIHAFCINKDETTSTDEEARSAL